MKYLKANNIWIILYEKNINNYKKIEHKKENNKLKKLGYYKLNKKAMIKWQQY